MSEEHNLDLNQIKKALFKRLEELQQISAASQESRAAVELDQTRVGRLSRMDALQMQAMSEENERQRQQEIQRIHVAIKRIESDDYGYCISCDEPIAEKRLQLDFSILTCIHCAKSKEQHR
ncbi:TraR/DksA family transcriptional regulator [Magnetococcales bacterium HHB-1]